MLRIPFILDVCAPIATKQGRYSKGGNKESLNSTRGIIRPSSSAFEATCVCIRKKSGTLYSCQDYQRLNMIRATDSGGLGGPQSIFDKLRGFGSSSSVNLASGYFKLEIKEHDKHKTTFRDADGRLWDY